MMISLLARAVPFNFIMMKFALLILAAGVSCTYAHDYGYGVGYGGYGAAG